MALKLSDVMKMNSRSRLSKDANNVQQAKDMANLLREREAQRKRDIEAANVRFREAIRDAEDAEERRRVAEWEAKRKPFFEVDKYNRKIPLEGEPLYWGDTRQAGDAWEPHGQGSFIMNDETVMEGQFIRGALVQGLVKWSDGSTWEGSMEDHRMNGVGFITSAEGARREVIMRNNVITCYKEDVVNGLQIRFEQQLHEVYPSVDRLPIATIVRCVRRWVYLCKFSAPVWPQTRQIDFRVNPHFQILRAHPLIFSLQGFGLDSEPARTYDFRYTPPFQREELRETAAGALMLQHATDEMFSHRSSSQQGDQNQEENQNQQGNQGTTLGLLLELGDEASVGSEESIGFESAAHSPTKRLGFSLKSPGMGSGKGSAAQLRDKLTEHSSKVRSFVSGKGKGGGGGGGSGKGKGGGGGDYTEYREGSLPHYTFIPTDKQPIILPTQTALQALETRKLPKLHRLIPQFPIRSNLDRTDNVFEARALGVGAAREEEEAGMQAELRRKQWAVLIEERRARQEEEKKRAVEEQQRGATELALEERRERERGKKEEEERFRLETQEAVEMELQRMDRA